MCREAKETSKKHKNPSRIPMVKDGVTSPERSRFFILGLVENHSRHSVFVNNIETLCIIKNTQYAIKNIIMSIN